jgi:hypothetical protein
VAAKTGNADFLAFGRPLRAPASVASTFAYCRC